MWKATDKGRIIALIEMAKERGVAMEIQPALWYHPERAGRKRSQSTCGSTELRVPRQRCPCSASLQTLAERYDEIVERFDLTSEKMWLPPSVS